MRYDGGVFREPDWSTPIDVDARVQAIPSQSMVRGMFCQFLIEAIGTEPPKHVVAGRYVAFKNYAMRDYVKLLVWGAGHAFPRLPLAEAVRRLGRCIYPNYANTMTGTAIFAAAGHNFRRVLELCPTAYKVAVSGGTVSLRAIEEHHAIVEFRGIWNFPEFHQIGIFEGAMDVCSARGDIAVDVHGLDSVDLDVRWTDRFS